MGIFRGFCRRFAEGDEVSIIDVSNDRKVTYVLHIVNYCALRLVGQALRSRCSELNVCLTETPHSTLQREGEEMFLE